MRARVNLLFGLELQRILNGNTGSAPSISINAHEKDQNKFRTCNNGVVMNDTDISITSSFGINHPKQTPPQEFNSQLSSFFMQPMMTNLEKTNQKSLEMSYPQKAYSSNATEHNSAEEYSRLQSVARMAMNWAPRVPSTGEMNRKV